MTVYAVWIKCSTQQAGSPDSVPAPEPPDLIEVIPDRIQQNVFDTIDEVLKKQAKNASVMNTEIDGSGIDYISAVHRAEQSVDKKDFLDKVEKGAVADADWYRIEMHVCDHDESSGERTGCGDWQTEREHGTVPDGVK
jgi:hypothetical protein